MTGTVRLMSIGDFSSRSRLSVRMLRHYGEHGILVPAEVDPVSGYRRYSEGQLEEAAHVRRLRDVGFTVSAMSVLLAARGTESHRRALALQREALDGELRAARERLALIDQLLDQEGSVMPAITVSRETVPARSVVALRGVVPAYDQEGRLWQQLVPELDRQGITPLGPGGVFEHDTDYKESDPTLSIWLPVEPGTAAQEPLTDTTSPSRRSSWPASRGPTASSPRRTRASTSSSAPRGSRSPPGRASTTRSASSGPTGTSRTRPGARRRTWSPRCACRWRR